MLPSSLALEDAVLSSTVERRGIKASKTRVAFRVIDSEHFGEGRMMNASTNDEAELSHSAAPITRSTKRPASQGRLHF